ncbi:hypothetical protein [Pseudomonas alliivorans]|uniref:hypothetical protein n=1 Tax=Pseudomonas alliivorans TaxID=2810613 RepID=UPI003FA0697D
MVSDHTFREHLLFGAGAESIGVAMPLQATEYDRDYRYQHPPATAISVMKPANAHRKPWNENSDGIKGGDQLVSAQKTIEKTEDHGDQEVSQKNIQNSFLRALPLKTAYFLKTSKYQNVDSGASDETAPGVHMISLDALQCGQVSPFSVSSFAQL